jgi:hypothetical protein
VVLHSCVILIWNVILHPSVPDGVDESDLMDELSALEDGWEGEASAEGELDSQHTLLIYL